MKLESVTKCSNLSCERSSTSKDPFLDGHVHVSYYIAVVFQFPNPRRKVAHVETRDHSSKVYGILNGCGTDAGILTLILLTWKIR